MNIQDLQEVTTISEQLDAISHQIEFLTSKIDLGTLTQQIFDASPKSSNGKKGQLIIRNKSILQECAKRAIGVFEEFKMRYEARLKDLGVEV